VIPGLHGHGKANAEGTSVHMETTMISPDRIGFRYSGPLPRPQVPEAIQAQ
jgi:hypothetical protein